MGLDPVHRIPTEFGWGYVPYPGKFDKNLSQLTLHGHRFAIKKEKKTDPGIQIDTKEQ
jgi:hypothetical protein